jgi:hypothetical protein
MLANDLFETREELTVTVLNHAGLPESISKGLRMKIDFDEPR